MSDAQERSLRLAAKANRERLAVAHREAVMQEEEKRTVDVRRNMARLKELRLVKEAQRLGRQAPKQTITQHASQGDSDKRPIQLAWARDRSPAH
jgi:hypothetical protein